jgi:hypothetical protein
MGFMYILNRGISMRRRVGFVGDSTQINCKSYLVLLGCVSEADAREGRSVRGQQAVRFLEFANTSYDKKRSTV